MSVFYKLTDSYVSFELPKFSPKLPGSKTPVTETPTSVKTAQTFEEAITKLSPFNLK